MIASRRRFLFGAGATAASLVAAPAIVRVAANLMPIKPLRLDGYGHVWREFTCSDLTLSVEKFSERVLRPQMLKLANQIDELVAAEFTQQGWPWAARA